MVDIEHPRAVVDDVVTNIRQLLDSLSHEDRCRVLGSDANDDSRPCTTVAAPEGVYTPIPRVPIRSTVAEVETDAEKLFFASKTTEGKLEEDVTIPRVRSVSTREATGSDTDGDEALGPCVNPKSFETSRGCT